MRFFIIVMILSSSLLALEQQITTTDRYVAGGVVGSLVGLGIGQAINGNYTNSGWVFTLSEGVSVTALISGALIYNYGAPYLTYGQAFNLGLSLLIPGAVTFSIFHIWDMIDLWTTPYVDHESIGLSFHF